MSIHDSLAPILLSFRVAGLSTLITIIAGTGMALILPRRPGLLSRVLEGLVILPMVFPPTITGYLLLLLLGRRGPLGSVLESLGSGIVFTWGAAVVASVVVSLPLMYQNAKAAFAAVDPGYAQAARSLGLREGKILARITLPLASPGLVAGSLLAFARAFGEFGATLMVAGNIPGRTQTIPLALYSAVEGGRDREAGFLLAVTVLTSFAIVLVVGLSQARAERRSGGSFPPRPDGRQP